MYDIFVSDIAIFVLKRDVKLQLTNYVRHLNYRRRSELPPCNILSMTVFLGFPESFISESQAGREQKERRRYALGTETLHRNKDFVIGTRDNSTFYHTAVKLKMTNLHFEGRL